MIFKRLVLILALLCSIRMITNHGHNELSVTMGKGKMDCKFFCLIDQGHILSLEPQGDTSVPTPEEVSFLDQKGLDYPEDIYKLINHNIEAKAIWDNVKMLLAGSELTKEDRESLLLHFLRRNNKLRNLFLTPGNQATIQDGRVVVQNVQGRQNQNQNQRYDARGNGAASNAKRPQNSDYFKDKMLLMQAQENGAVLDEEELLFLAGEQGNTFDADVDNQPVQDLALNEDNIFQADECDAFDSDVDDEPTAQTIFMANLSLAGSANPQAGPSNASILSEVHTLENAIDHSVTNQDEHEIHNEVQQSNVIDSTSVYMGNRNVIPYEQYLSVNNISVVPSCASSTLNNVCVSSDNDAFVPHDPIANELKIYKEQVAIYEQRAKFELTEREQRMDDQMRMLIQNRNKTEENLKKELHSVKLQLNSTMENNKIIEGTAKKAQPGVLYDGDELLKPHHVPVIVPLSEEELELAEATRNKLHVKMNDSACVEKRSKYFGPVDLAKDKRWTKANPMPHPLPVHACDCSVPKDFSLAINKNASTNSLRKSGVTFVEHMKPHSNHTTTSSADVCEATTATKVCGGLSKLSEVWKATGKSYNLACITQPDLICNWGSNVSKKCRILYVPLYNSVDYGCAEPFLTGTLWTSGLSADNRESGLVPNSAPAIPYVPPTNKDLELLFNGCFDEFFEISKGCSSLCLPVPTAPTPVHSNQSI
ncbi:hypothetical protein Tco_1146614 [Tanacetum coccineum]